MFTLLRKTKSSLLLSFSFSNANISMIIVMIFILTYIIVFKITNIKYTILFKIIYKNINCIILYTNMNIFHLLYLHRNWLFLLYDTNPFMHTLFLLRLNKACYNSWKIYGFNCTLFTIIIVLIHKWFLQFYYFRLYYSCTVNMKNRYFYFTIYKQFISIKQVFQAIILYYIAFLVVSKCN